MSDTTIEEGDYDRGYLPAEFIDEREQFYVAVRDKKTLLGCGDERPLTEASGKYLAAQYPEALSPIEAFTSVYGGIAGVAKNILVAGTAQYGSVFIEEHGDFSIIFTKAIERLRADDDPNALVPALHSSATKEHDDATFDASSSEDIDCKYAAGIGATSRLLLDQNGIIQLVARHDQIIVHGNDKDFERLLDGHLEFLQQAIHGQGGDFALSREDYATAESAIMILAGTPHAPAEATGLINSYDLDSVRSCNQAAEAGKPFYNQDIARVVSAILRVFPDMKLEPELLMRAFLLDATPVRAALAAGDKNPKLQGVLDPRNLRMGIRGNVQQAVEALSANA